jgi:Phage tail tube protein
MRPTTLLGTHVIIEVGDGGSPEVFVAPCALTTKNAVMTNTMNEFAVPDCDDPDAPVWIERAISQKSFTISGSGTLAMESFDSVWRPWIFEGDVAKNIRYRFDLPLADGGGWYYGAFKLASAGTPANVGELAQIEIELSSHGEVTWVPAAA